MLPAPALELLRGAHTCHKHRLQHCSNCCAANNCLYLQARAPPIVRGQTSPQTNTQRMRLQNAATQASVIVTQVAVAALLAMKEKHASDVSECTHSHASACSQCVCPVCAHRACTLACEGDCATVHTTSPVCAVCIPPASTHTHMHATCSGVLWLHPLFRPRSVRLHCPDGSGAKRGPLRRCLQLRR